MMALHYLGVACLKNLDGAAVDGVEKKVNNVKKNQ